MRMLAVVLTLLVPMAAGAQELNTARQLELVRMVRQDCGSCHGMWLSGGLGPPLTRTALEGKPVGSMAATIFHGRPGTPMPPWKALLSQTEAAWIADQLVRGMPAEVQVAR